MNFVEILSSKRCKSEQILSLKNAANAKCSFSLVPKTDFDAADNEHCKVCPLSVYGWLRHVSSSIVEQIFRVSC